MRFPRLPDWVVYAAIVVALLFAALGRDERTDAPPPPPKGADPLGEALGPASPFDPSVVVDVPDTGGPAAGTAFSIAGAGAAACAAPPRAPRRAPPPPPLPGGGSGGGQLQAAGPREPGRARSRG